MIAAISAASYAIERERIGRDGDARPLTSRRPALDASSAAVAISAISRACSVDSRASAASESFSSSVKPARRAEVAGELDRVLLVLAAEATEVEDRVDRALELERPLAALGVLVGEAAQPVGAHLHVGDLVGEHPVLAELEDRVARLVAELLHRAEHVDGEALERAVHAAEAQHRVGVARGREEERRLGVLTDLGAHVVAELDRDLAVAGLVPALARHVELQLERRRRRRRSRSRCGRRLRAPGSRRRRCRASANANARPRRDGRRAILAGPVLRMRDLRAARDRRCGPRSSCARSARRGRARTRRASSSCDRDLLTSASPRLPGPAIPPDARYSCSSSAWRRGGPLDLLGRVDQRLEQHLAVAPVLELVLQGELERADRGRVGDPCSCR